MHRNHATNNNACESGFRLPAPRRHGARRPAPGATAPGATAPGATAPPRATELTLVISGATARGARRPAPSARRPVPLAKQRFCEFSKFYNNSSIVDL